MEYEYDTEVPYWRTNPNVQALYDTHGREGQEATDLLIELGLAEPDSELAFGPMAVMNGQFLPLLTNAQTYQNTFTPGSGDLALVLPIKRDGETVDLLAVSASDVAVWGCVTGKGAIAGHVREGQPVRVYEAPWRWLLFGCDGVVVLAKNAFPKLSAASSIIAESLDHADDLTERVFLRPVLEKPELENSDAKDEARAIAAANAELEARDRIHVDEDRYDIEEELLQRAVVDTVAKLKIEGALN